MSVDFPEWIAWFDEAGRLTDCIGRYAKELSAHLEYAGNLALKASDLDSDAFKKLSDENARLREAASAAIQFMTCRDEIQCGVFKDGEITCKCGCIEARRNLYNATVEVHP